VEERKVKKEMISAIEKTKEKKENERKEQVC
jgi:hypothetical protein